MTITNYCPLNIPKDVWVNNILLNITPLSLWRFRQVCKSWHEIGSIDEVWKKIFKKYFSLEQRIPLTSWRLNCKKHLKPELFKSGNFTTHLFLGKNVCASDKENYVSVVNLTIEVWNYKKNEKIVHVNLEQNLKNLPKDKKINELIINNALVIFSLFNLIGMWNWKKKPIKVFLIKAHANEIYSFSFQQDKIATLSKDKVMKVWQLNKTGRSHQLKCLSSHSFPNDTQPQMISLYDQHVAVSFKNCRLEILNWQSKDLSKVTKTFYTEVKKIILQNDLVVAKLEKQLILWNWKRGDTIKTFSKDCFGDVALEENILVFRAPKKTSFWKDIQVWNWRTNEKLLYISSENGKKNPFIHIQGNNIRLFYPKKIQVLTFL